VQPDVPPDPVERKAPWGFWATVGFSVIMGGAFLGIQAVVFGIFVGMALASRPDLAVPVFASDLRSNGFFLAVATLVSSPICIILTVVCVRLRRGWSVREYLALKAVRRADLVKWLGWILVFAVISDALTLLLGRTIVPDFVARAYATASFVPLLWIALVVAAPAFEEVFFRGFMFRGFEHSRVGPMGAVVLTSIVFGVVHIQYDAYGIATTVAIGLLLGLARRKTASLYPAVAMHALINFLATLEAALL
jgi:hypothetical protein